MGRVSSRGQVTWLFPNHKAPWPVHARQWFGLESSLISSTSGLEDRWLVRPILEAHTWARGCLLGNKASLIDHLKTIAGYFQAGKPDSWHRTLWRGCCRKPLKNIRTEELTGVLLGAGGIWSPWGHTQKCDSELLQWLGTLWAISGQYRLCYM